MSPSAGKVSLVAFWDSRGKILAHFMPKRQTVKARYYFDVVLKEKKNLIENTEKKLRPRLTLQNILLLHDNAPSHTASSTIELRGNCCRTLRAAQTLFLRLLFVS